MAVTVPTYEAGSWDHEASVGVPQLMKTVEDVTKINHSTFNIMWHNKEYYQVNNDGTFKLNLEYGAGNPRYGALNMVFNTEHEEKSTRLEFTPQTFYGGSSISDLKIGAEYSGSTQIVNEMDYRNRHMNKGLTLGLGYEVWAPTAYTTTETDLSSGKIVIDDIVTNIQTECEIRNVPSTAAGRITSLPSIIKPHGAGHTYGGFSSANLMWRSHVYHNNGFTEIDPDNYSTYCANAPSSNVDLVTTMSTNTQWSVENIDDWLAEIQIGAGYEIYIACPQQIYFSIGRYMHGNDFGSAENPLVDMSVDASFKHPAGNAVFYADPVLSKMWPNSLWAYDPQFTHFACVEGKCPVLYPWRRIEGSTSVVMAKVMRIELVCLNRRSTGALHGVTK